MVPRPLVSPDVPLHVSASASNGFPSNGFPANGLAASSGAGHARASGLLLHATSLPSAYGIGDLGPAAFAFVDALARAGQSLWQMLPLGPVGYGGAPYSSPSTFAGNPLLLSPARLADDGLVGDDDLAPLADLPAERVDFARLVPLKRDLLRTAFARYEAGHGAIDAAEVARFRQAHAGWLDDYALYAALKMAHDERAWLDWDASLVTRAPDALADAREVHARAIRMHAFWQYLFQRQWDALRQHAHARDVTLFGDIPIYVALDSADVWANQDLFQMDDNGQPIAVAGVPPDYFSETGQLWGNPLYDWGRMRRTDYAWWTRRLQRMMDLVDLVRLDHFRGLEAYWSVPAHHDTAQHGTWVDGPADALLRTLRERLGGLPLVAEDLGEITPEVYALRDRFGLPGMSLLQFAFNGDPSNQFLPHNYDRRVVAYPGTHDNNTLLGWWRTEADPDTKAQMARYLGLASEDDAPNWPAIRTLMASVAQRVVIPVQDVLELGAEARLNTPGTTGEANWTWRMTPGALAADRLDRLGALTHTFGRAAGTPAKPPASPMMVPSLADTEG